MGSNDRKYTNKDITVYWKPDKCVHAAICVKELPEVFKVSRRPWVDLSKGTTEEIIDIVNRCPTDALTYEKNSDIKAEPPVVFTVMRNGPILAEGSFTIIKPDGTEQQINQMTSFCRCGMSKNKPFCDGTHNKRGFFPDEPSY